MEKIKTATKITRFGNSSYVLLANWIQKKLNIEHNDVIQVTFEKEDADSETNPNFE